MDTNWFKTSDPECSHDILTQDRNSFNCIVMITIHDDSTPLKIATN